MNYINMDYIKSLLCFSTFSLSACNLYASQDIYDFGFFGTPQTTFDNPVGLVHCESQVVSSLAGIATDFSVDSDTRDYEVEQFGNKVMLNVGSCVQPVDWVSFGFSFNLSPLTFNFETEQSGNRKIYPYMENASPLLGVGTAIRITEKVSWGVSLQAIVKAFLLFEESVVLDLDEGGLFSSLDVSVRPEFFPSTGLSYELGDFAGLENITLYSSWRDAQESEFRFELDVALILALLNVDLPLESPLLSVVGKLDSVPERFTVGGYAYYKAFEFDVSVTEEKWSGMNHPFLDLSLTQEILGLLNPLLFPEVRGVEFQDVYNLNVLARYQYTDNLTLMGGYGYRGDAVASEDKNQSIMGSDMHLIKAGFAYNFEFGKFPVQIDGHMVYGHMMEGDLVDDETFDGNFVKIYGSTRVFF